MVSPHFACATLRGLRFGRAVLLWLAVLVALAQVVAIRHAYSHTAGEPSRQSSGKHPGGIAHCHSCIVAATIGGGAPPTSALLLLALADLQPAIFAPAVERSTPRNRPYAIRAPPAIAT